MDALLQHLEPFVERICKPIAMQDSSDAVQESMIVIYQNLRSLEKPAAIFGWARIISLREAARVARLSGRVIATEQIEIAGSSTPQLGTEIRDVLGRMTPEHRAMLTLRHVQELDEQTVAKSLDLPLGTVRSRLFRARRAFRQAWDGNAATG
ncbi:sigma-70 family RNA polymerase sigma factor [Actinocorallia longicatena]|uniref:RNA polymerase sigma factor 70 region 4 type 2 domain-containing protein n=1 Tax=Actinocorallia longicatena TaxID=111803 RepID=A0ABP6Q6U3_9ACTN